jgi:hypothetical protein
MVLHGDMPVEDAGSMAATRKLMPPKGRLMNDDELPHFLRVVPIATAITSVVAGVHCGFGNRRACYDCNGFGTGGATTSTSTGTSGGTSSSSSGEVGFFPMDGGYEGGPVGDVVMPDAGEDGGS